MGGRRSALGVAGFSEIDDDVCSASSSEMKGCGVGLF